jgi:hypothetical protein
MSIPKTASSLPAPRWLHLHVAAAMLDTKPATLRRAIERRARLGPDGVLEAFFDGLRARKLGGRWRVALSEAWTRGGDR